MALFHFSIFLPTIPSFRVFIALREKCPSFLVLAHLPPPTPPPLPVPPPLHPAIRRAPTLAPNHYEMFALAGDAGTHYAAVHQGCHNL